MKIGFFEFHYLQMEGELNRIMDEGFEVEEGSIKAIRVVQKCLATYREYLRNHLFERKSEEIHFFKVIKPKVMAELIYFAEMFNWWNDRPKYGDKEEQKAYWEGKKEMSRSFLREHAFFAGYLSKGYTWLDTQLFVAANRDRFYHWGIPKQLDSIALQEELTFTSSHDHLAARLLAYNRLYQFCIDEMEWTFKEEADFRGGNETTFNVVPLLQQFKGLAAGESCYTPPVHIPRNELDRSLERFMQVNLMASPQDRKSGNARMSNRMRRRIRKFLAIWRAENRDVEYEQPVDIVE